MKSSDFYCKRHILAWIHVVWAILLEDRLGGLTSRGEPEKSQKVTRGSHRNDVSPLTQGLRYRAAYDVAHHCQKLMVIFLNICLIVTYLYFATSSYWHAKVSIWCDVENVLLCRYCQTIHLRLLWQSLHILVLTVHLPMILLVEMLQKTLMKVCLLHFNCSCLLWKNGQVKVETR